MNIRTLQRILLPLLALAAMGQAFALDITGRVYWDAYGKAAASSASSVGLGGGTNTRVRVFDASGVLKGTVNAAANGSYSFTGLNANTTYYVTTSFDPANVFPNLASYLQFEQTTGSVGSTAAPGSGPICSLPEPTYTGQSGSTPAEFAAWVAGGQGRATNPNSITCYGGMRGDVEDDYYYGALTNDRVEHVTRVNTASSNVSDVNFGFATNVITRNVVTGGTPGSGATAVLAASIDGSMGAWMANTGQLTGSLVTDPAMRNPRFVMAVPPDTNGTWGMNAGLYFDGTTTKYHNIVVDGTAYSNTDGVSPRDTNPHIFPGAPTVGWDGSKSIASFKAPEIVMQNTITLGGQGTNCVNNLTFKNLGFQAQGASGSKFLVACATNVVIEDNVFCSDMTATAAYGNSINCSGISVGYNSTASQPVSVKINHNYTAYLQGGALLSDLSNSTNPSSYLNFTNNLIEYSNAAVAAVNSFPHTVTGTIINNMIRNGGGGIQLFRGGQQPYTIEDNSIIDNRNSGIRVGENTQYDSLPVAATNSRVIRHNLIQRNGTAGQSTYRAAIDMNGHGWKITQNTFGNNNGMAIDLAMNGPSFNETATPGECNDPGYGDYPQSMLARPMLYSATVQANGSVTVDGSVCNNGSFDVEIYAVTVDPTPANGDFGSIDGNNWTPGQPVGEGVRYLGTISTSNGSFSGNLGSGLPAGTKIGAIAIRTGLGATKLATTGTGTWWYPGYIGDTSEFSMTGVFIPKPPSISGNIYLDELGTAAAAGAANTSALAATNVYLFNSAGTLLASTPTDATGNYKFEPLTLNTDYYVKVDPPTSAKGGTGMLLEQTTGTAGSGAVDVGLATGSGPICAKSALAYGEQANAATAAAMAAWTAGAQGGATAITCYGGRQGAMANTASATALLSTNAEHVTRIKMGGVAVTGVNFGFSSNVVTNTNTLGQGSFSAFVANANSAATLPRTMRFVPAMATNASGTGQTWWKIAGTTSYEIRNPDTTVDGTAYSNTDGSTLLNTNAATLGGATVGVDGVTIPVVNGPELQVEFAAVPVTTANGSAAFFINANNATFVDMGLTGGGRPLILVNAGTGHVIKDNVIGSQANTLAAPTAAQAGSGVQIGVVGTVAAGQGVLIDHNIIAFMGVNGIFDHNTGASTTTTTTNNYLYKNNLGFFADRPVGTGLVQNNFINSSTQQGFLSAFTTARSSKYELINNTVSGNGWSGIETGGDARTSLNNLIFKNVIQSNGATGTLSNGNAGISTMGHAWKVSQNSFSGNTGNAIDLGSTTNARDGVTYNQTAVAGVCANRYGNLTSLPNDGMPRPVINSATKQADGSYLVSGTVCSTGTYDIELYAVDSASATGDTGPGNGNVPTSGVQAGEGKTYVGTASASNGTFSATLPASAGLTANSQITALAIRTSAGTAAAPGLIGDTSEFGVNIAVPDQKYAISGNIYLDEMATAAAHGAAQTRALGSSDAYWGSSKVYLFDSNGVLLDTQTPDATGAYTFANRDGGKTYYVKVDLNGMVDTVGGFQLEQTTGTAGTGAVVGTAAQSGPICGKPAPLYGEQANTANAAGLAAWTAGAQGGTGSITCYGGRQANQSNVAGANLLNANAEHVTRIVLGSSNVTGVNFGFSSNAVVNTNASGTGSALAFLQNANIVTTVPRTMRFVPAVPSNQTGGGQNWWEVTGFDGVNNFVLTKDDVTIDGTAYSNTNGATVINSNNTQLGGATVGVDNIVIPKVNGPELVWTGGAALEVNANRLKISNMGFVTKWLRFASGVGHVFKDNTMGTKPYILEAATTNEPMLIEIGDRIYHTGTGASVDIDHNILSFSAAPHGTIFEGSTGADKTVAITRNYMYKNADPLILGDTLATGNFSSNYVDATTRYAVEGRMGNSANPYQFLNNTFSNGTNTTMSVGTFAPAGTRTGVAILVSKNVVSNNSHNGINPGGYQSIAEGWRISQNSFFGNAGNAIDLKFSSYGEGPSPNFSATPGECLNQSGSTSHSQHSLARPMLSSVTVQADGSVSVAGSVCKYGSFDVEFYAVDTSDTRGDVGAGDGLVPASGVQAGEGKRYIGTLTVGNGSNGLFSGTLPAAGLSAGSVIGAIAIRTAPSASIAGVIGDTSEFSGNALVTTPPKPKMTLKKISNGAVGTFDFTGDNGFAASSVTTTVAGSAATASNPAQGLAATNVSTTITETAAAGWTISSVSCLDAAAASSGNIATALPVTLASSGKAFTLDATVIRTNADISCTVTNGYSVPSVPGIYGKVFSDTGVSKTVTAANGTTTVAGIANNALQDGGESALSGVTVKLSNCSTGAVLTTTQTAGDGSYYLAVPTGTAGNLCVTETNPAGYLSTGVASAYANTYTKSSDTVQINFSGSDVKGVDFADVPQSRLNTDGRKLAKAGSTVYYPHTFVAGTAGSVSFKLQNPVSNPANPAWAESIVIDSNCNGVLDAAETSNSLTTPNATPVVAGQTLCLLVSEMVPSNATLSATREVELSAEMSWSNLAGISEALTRKDITEVSNESLVLTKDVRNVSADALAGGVENWFKSNQARSGDTLEYRLGFCNTGATSISSLNINDSTPAYTKYLSAACPPTLAQALSACATPSNAAATAPALNAGGALKWVFQGSLLADQCSTVTYRVKVE